MPDQPWIFRTYAGHSTPKASNELYLEEPGQGADRAFPIAFDLPTQTGYDSDHPLARGEVGKVGVPVSAPRRHARAVRGHPARQDEHVDDDQRDGGVACSRCTSLSPTNRASTASR